jgi:uncharacterized protein (TIGR03083 family)
MPTRDEFLDSFHRDAELVEAAIRAGGDLTQPIDGCPDWELASLVEHLGTLHRFVASGITTNGTPERPDVPSDRGVYAEWFAEGAAALEALLRSKPDDEPCWTFFPNAPQQIGTWVRRQAQELAVHRYDAELAATGTAEAIDPVIAVDGIDEYLDLFLERVDARRPIRIGELAVQLRTLGVEPEQAWMIRCGDDAPSVSREHGKGDVAVLGSPGNLLLCMWGRVRPGELDLELYGDPELWDRFHAAASI